MKKTAARAVIEDTINVINLEEEKKRKIEINDSVKKEIYKISAECNRVRMDIVSFIKIYRIVASANNLMNRYRNSLENNSYLTEEFVSWRDSKKLYSEDKAIGLKNRWLRNLAELEQLILDMRGIDNVQNCKEN